MDYQKANDTSDNDEDHKALSDTKTAEDVRIFILCVSIFSEVI